MPAATPLSTMVLIYQVPEDVRKKKIRRVLDMEYAVVGQKMLEEFISYIEQTNEQAFEDLLNRK